jgi:tetratricopeptide (TPR) repeat protein
MSQDKESLVHSDRKQDIETKLSAFLWPKRLLAFLTACIGVVTTAYQFIQLWRGEQGLVTFIITGLGFLLLLSVLVFAGFCKINSIVYPHSKVRPFPRYYKHARFGLGVIILCALVAVFVLYKRDLHLRNKVIIVVANFYGSDSQKYQVTEEILTQLHLALDGYKDTLIIALGSTISEQQGSEEARRLGEEHRADLVLWGRVAISNTDVRQIIYLENLTQQTWLPFTGRAAYPFQAAISELDHFEFQKTRSEEMAALMLFISALARHEADDYSGVIDRLNAALALDKWPESLVSKALLFLSHADASAHLGNYQQSINDCTKSIEINPRLSEAYNTRGISYIELKDYHKALLDLSQAIEIAPQYSNYFYNRGMAYRHLGDIQKSVDDFSESINLDTARSEPYHCRGHAFLEKGDALKSIDDFTKAIKIQPNAVEFYVDRATAYFAAGDFKNAISDYSQAIKKEPKLARAHNERGHAYEKSGEMEKAFADYIKALDLDPNFVEAYNHLGLAYSKQDNCDKAIEYYSRGISLDPDSATLYFNRGIVYLRLSLFNEARDDFSKCIRLKPDKTRAYRFRAHARTKLGELDEAMVDLCRALEMCNEPDLRILIEKDMRDIGMTRCDEKQQLANTK